MGSLPRQQRYAKDVQYKINDMKQITISIILLLLIGGTAFAQEATTQDSLIGKWRFIYPPHKSKGITHTFVYTEQKEYITVSYGLTEEIARLSPPITIFPMRFPKNLIIIKWEKAKQGNTLWY